MSDSRLVLKQRTGWFAAGREFQDAMRLLSDAAFKLYVWLCLNAERRLGVILCEPDRLAVVLGVERHWIDASLAELRQQRVCRTDGGRIEIEDRFWPYRKEPRPSTAPEEEYVRQVRALFTAPACVHSAFTAADERIAIELYRRAIALDTIRHAIWLGAARRYITMLNGQVAAPVTSLRYFALVVDEITRQTVPDGYWEHVRRRADQLERRWLQQQSQAAPLRCPASPESRPTSPE